MRGFTQLCEAITSWRQIHCDGLRHELIHIMQLYKQTLAPVRMFKALSRDSIKAVVFVLVPLGLTLPCCAGWAVGSAAASTPAAGKGEAEADVSSLAWHVPLAHMRHSEPPSRHQQPHAPLLSNWDLIGCMLSV